MAHLNRILLIDDDVTSNYLNSFYIKNLQLTNHISEATNGQMALDIINACDQKKLGDNSIPDLILIDINMPIMDGFEFMENYDKLDSCKKNSTIICMLTTSLNPIDEARAKAFKSIDLYVQKPLSKEALGEIIRSI